MTCADIAVRDTGVGSELVARPEHESQASGLEEDSLLDLLAAPPEPLVELSGRSKVRDAEGDEADALVHGRRR